MSEADDVTFAVMVSTTGDYSQLHPITSPDYTAITPDPMPPAGVKILFLLGWMDVVVARSRQVVVLAM